MSIRLFFIVLFAGDNRFPGIWETIGELGLDVETVRNYFGGKPDDKRLGGVHFEPGPDGGVVTLDDTTILDVAMRILGDQNK